MKYFTRGMANGELDDAECERITAAYHAHIAAIRPTLPPDFSAIVDLQLHDGLVDRIRWNPTQRHLSMTLVSTGPGDLSLTVRIDYEGALLGQQRVDALRRAATSRETCILDHEVDRDGELLVHRYLFWPNEEVTIDCSAVRVTVELRSSAAISLPGAFVEE